MDTKYVWVVTYWRLNNEWPNVKVFNNEAVARDCFNYFKDRHHACCIDKYPIYSAFKVAGESNEFIMESED